MLRTTLLLVAAAALAGCENGERKVYGDAAFHGDVYGTANTPRLHGDSAFHSPGKIQGDRSFGPSDATARADETAVRTASVRTSSSNPDNTTVTQSTEVRRSAPVVTESTEVRRSGPADTTHTETTRTPAASDVTRSTATETNSPSGAPGIVPPGAADPERAAFAATAHYPNDLQASNDLKATALVGREAGSIKIANASDQPIRDAKLWIDGRYVTQINELPAHGTLTLSRREFSDRDGKLPTDLKNVRQIQLQTKDNLYNLQGPVFDEK